MVNMLMSTTTMESIRPLDNDSRRAVWAGKFYGMGLHREPVTDCPQSESPIRERAYAPGQEPQN